MVGLIGDEVLGPQVLTLSDWQYIMYNVASSTGPWSALYFYSLLFFGNYVLLNIFIGIVVVGFGESQVPA